MKNIGNHVRRALVSIILSSLIISQVAITSSVPNANAAESNRGESIIDVATFNHVKKAMIRQLAESIAKHEKMSLDEIKLDLKSAAEKNRDFLTAHGQLSTTAENTLNHTLKRLEDVKSKPELIRRERQALKSMVSATNYMFFLCSKVMWNFYGGGIFQGFLMVTSFAMDLVGIVLLIEPIMSMFSITAPV